MIWRFSDVSDSKEYRLHLCQSKDGDRFFRLIEVGSDAEKNPLGDVILATNVVPNELLKKRDVISISELICLDDGQSFFVDSHGVWLAYSELREMDAGLGFDEINWLSGQVPKFPSR